MRRVLVIAAFAGAVLRTETARADEPRSTRCVEGAPRSETLDDCPEALSTGDDYAPWDDLNPFGGGLRLSLSPTLIAGLGLVFRYAPSRLLSFDLGTDYLIGRDPYGQARREAVVAIDALAFLYRGSSIYTYTLSGVGASYARIAKTDDDRLAHASYLGLRLGGGVEFKGARDLGWNIDMVGFLRTRMSSDVDDGEILDGRPDQSRLSAGALLRAALIVYPHD